MTKRDYESIATVIKGARSIPPKRRLTFIAGHLAGVFKADNLRFDWDRFMDACGVEVPNGRRQPQED